jgi:6,7-dimethyl-8-ribityllumazine synthase
MVRAARKELLTAGASSVRVIRVPGAFEIPVVTARLAANNGGGLSAIICLGVIFRGETLHAQHIGDAVSSALADIQIRHHVPVIHGVYLFENEEQARVRCLGKKYGRGIETARTALVMAQVMANL